MKVSALMLAFVGVALQRIGFASGYGYSILPNFYDGRATVQLSNESGKQWNSGSYNNKNRVIDGTTSINSGNFGSRIIDANTGTGTCVERPYVTVDLHRQEMIDGIRVWWYYLDHRKYCGVQIEVSADGVHWDSVYHPGGNGYTDYVSSSGNDYHFTRRPVRYFRVHTSRSDVNEGIHLVEVAPLKENRPTIAPSPYPTKAPTPFPTSSPSSSPTDAPVASPTNSPSADPSPNPTAPPVDPSRGGGLIRPDPHHDPHHGKPAAHGKKPQTPSHHKNIAIQGSSHGDPHFSLFSGEKYDWHGACDLVLLSVPNFASDLGLKIHIRTKIASWWSFIEAAIIQIGDEVLELRGGSIGAGPSYWVNGQQGDKDVAGNPELLALHQRLEPLLPGFQVHYKEVSAKQHKFRIDLNRGGDAISIETFKDWVAVNVKSVQPESFDGALGLLGSYPSGEKVAPDGVTVMEDTDTFAKAWQVQSTQRMLFHNRAGPQHPEQCWMPEEEQATSQKRRRRLGESLLSTEDAERACAHAPADTFDACVFDVCATNDKDFAGSY